MFKDVFILKVVNIKKQKVYIKILLLKYVRTNTRMFFE